MMQPTKVPIVLPFEDGYWFCHADRGTVTRLVRLKTMGNARIAFDDEGKSFVVLDAARKRIAAYRILDGEPWLERFIAPVALPRTCFCRCMVMRGERVYVGHSRGGSFFIRDPDSRSDETWRVMDITSVTGSARKAVDGIVCIDSRLIVLDNFIVPVYYLEYAIDCHELRLMRHGLLPRHTTYERIVHASAGAPGIVIVSMGLNHLIVWLHVSVLDSNSMDETAVWDMAYPVMLSDEFVKRDQGIPLDKEEIYGIPSAEFVGDRLFIACNSPHIRTVTITRGTKQTGPITSLETYTIPNLVRVMDFAVPGNGDEGCFAIGEDARGKPAWHWIDAKDIDRQPRNAT